MGVDDIDVFELETFERRPSAFDDVFARETVVIDEDFAVRETPVKLAAVSALALRGLEVWDLVTLVVMTRSLLFQPNFLIACPMMISDCPPA